MAYSDDMEGEAHEASEGEIKTKKRLTYQELMLSPNIATMLDEDELGKIGALVTSEYEIDKSSRHDWEKRYASGIDLAFQRRVAIGVGRRSDREPRLVGDEVRFSRQQPAAASVAAN